MFKRDARPDLEMPLDVRALSDAALAEMIADLQRQCVVQKNLLHHRCVDRRCRRLRTCAAGGGRCVCSDVPRMGKRQRRRNRAAQAQSDAA